MFKLELGIQNVDNSKHKIFSRTAVRAVIFKEDKILMILTKLGDYKFPGGGINSGENNEEALLREVKEETGYQIKNINEKIGIAIQRKIDKYEENSIFEMTSYYYLCEILDGQLEQDLDDYEAEQNFKPVWVNIDQAIFNNELVLNEKRENINEWVYRETSVLKEIKNIWIDK